MTLIGPVTCPDCNALRTGHLGDDHVCDVEDRERHRERVAAWMRGMLAAHAIAVAGGCREAAVGFAVDEAEGLIAQHLNNERYGRS